MKKLLFVLLGLAALLGFVDLYLALIWSPPEATMGDLVRIMYFHVASAWTALLAFTVSFVAAIVFLFRRTRFWDALSYCSIEIGLVYTTITLITGSLWAKPVWNTWWTWDPRLTTTLILWFLFVGYMILRGTIEGVQRRGLVSAIFAIVAFADVPIIHVSVTLWNSMHPNLINDTGFNMPVQMAFTLMFGFVVFLLWYLVLVILRVRIQIAQSRLQELQFEAYERPTVLMDAPVIRGRH